MTNALSTHIWIDIDKKCVNQANCSIIFQFHIAAFFTKQKNLLRTILKLFFFLKLYLVAITQVN